MILLGEYGSRAMGTHNKFSDEDFMGVAIEDREYVLGLREWDQTQIKTALPGQRSGQGDVDQTIYSLRKWARLASRGNPTVLSLLFLPQYAVHTDLGQKLIDNRELFVSREAGRRHLGYMNGQRDAMTGQRNKRTNRPELVHQFGFDTKFGAHMIRLGMQGIELMQTGTIHIPMRLSARKTIVSIREGGYTKEGVLALADDLEAQLKASINLAHLPEEADGDKIDQLLIDLHEEFWKHGTL